MLCACRTVRRLPPPPRPSKECGSFRTGLGDAFLLALCLLLKQCEEPILAGGPVERAGTLSLRSAETCGVPSVDQTPLADQ